MKSFDQSFQGNSFYLMYRVKFTLILAKTHAFQSSNII